MLQNVVLLNSNRLHFLFAVLRADWLTQKPTRLASSVLSANAGFVGTLMIAHLQMLLNCYAVDDAAAVVDVAVAAVIVVVDAVAVLVVIISSSSSSSSRKVAAVASAAAVVATVAVVAGAIDHQ